jgi:hypothetical protein
MAKKKSKSRKKKSSGRGSWFTVPAVLRDMDWPTIGRYAKATAWIVCIGGIIGAWMWGVPRLQAYAAMQHLPPQIDIQFADPPAWMHEDLRLHLSLEAQRHMHGSALVQRDLVAVHDALMDSGFFTEIRQVRRERDNLVIVDGQYITPYALIRDADGDHPIDPFGTLLPNGQAENFVVIRGVRFDRPVRPGLRWEGMDVDAALRLLRLLDRQPWRTQVAELDLSHYMHDGMVDIIATTGGRILWGSPPGDEKPLEAATEFKLKVLNMEYGQRSGRIDAGGPTLDITRREGSFLIPDAP